MNEKIIVLRLQDDEKHRGNMQGNKRLIEHTDFYFVLIAVA